MLACVVITFLWHNLECAVMLRKKKISQSQACSLAKTKFHFELKNTIKATIPYCHTVRCHIDSVPILFLFTLCKQSKLCPSYVNHKDWLVVGGGWSEWNGIERKKLGHCAAELRAGVRFLAVLAAFRWRQNVDACILRFRCALNNPRWSKFLQWPPLWHCAS